MKIISFDNPFFNFRNLEKIFTNMRIAFVSDIHEDICGLSKAFKMIHKLNCDKIICLGDISGFSVPFYTFYNKRNASACLELIRKECDTIILGNHDLHAARILPENNMYTFPENWYTLDYYQKKEISHDKVWLYDDNELNPRYSDTDIEFLRKQKQILEIDIDNQNVLLSHYIFPNQCGSHKDFIHYQGNTSDHFSEMKKKGLSFCGHIHPGGFEVANEKKLLFKGFRRKYYIQEKSCIFVPAIVENHGKSGFLLWDTENMMITSIKN